MCSEDRNKMFNLIQKYLTDVPVILMGTGVTIPMGIPGMWKLAEHLKQSLEEKYSYNVGWKNVVSDLDNEIDLESSLTGKDLSKELVRDISVETWKFINTADLQLLSRLKNCTYISSLADLIKYFYSTSKKNVNIITTNYDRAIEYACDRVNIPIDKRFTGTYMKTFSTSSIKHKDIVNLFKIHGCLDLFSDSDSFVYSIPLQHDTPDGFVPAIVAPGTSKYEIVLNESYNRNVLGSLDNIINSASCYLCYGYGFNDSHIQQPMLEQLRTGKSIVIASLAVLDATIELIKKYSNNFTIIQRDANDHTKTHFTTADTKISLDGDFWSISGLLDIIK